MWKEEKGPTSKLGKERKGEDRGREKGRGFSSPRKKCLAPSLIITHH